MLAVFVNCAAVIAGALLGLLFRKKIDESLSDVVTTASGVVVLVIGMQMAFKYNSIIMLSVSVILGGIVGTKLNIDASIMSLGYEIQRYFRQTGNSSDSASFARAFLNASVLFCVGAMAVVGSFKAGIEGDYTIIFTKSVLDGFMAIIFGASMGIGTVFSAVSILVYQGLLTLCAGFLVNVITESMLTELSAAGGVLIMMIGINLLSLRQIKAANYLPAIIIAPLLVLIKGLF